MVNSRLIQLLRLLSPAEYRELGRFLLSPYHNTSKRVLLFYDLLKSFHPVFDDARLTKEEVFSKVYPEGKAINDAELRALMSDFSKRVEEFLVFQEIKNEPRLSQRHLTQAFGKRGEYTFFERATETMINALRKRKERDMMHYYELFDLNRCLFFHPLTHKNLPDIPSLNETVANLDKFFTLAKLRMGAEQLGRARSLAEQPQVAYLEEAQKQGEKYAEENPVFGIYLRILQLLQKGHDDEVFMQLKNDFLQHGHILRKEEQTEILPFLLNHANRQVHIGNGAYEQEQLELYRFGLEKGMLVENNCMDMSVFLNIISLGTRLGEFEWIEKVLKENQIFIGIEVRDGLVKYSQARILFYKGNFEEAGEILSMLHSSAPNLDGQVKRLAIQCLFELFISNSTYFDLLISRIEAFEKYRYRDKNFSKYLKDADRDFCRITRKLAHAFSLSDKLQRAELAKTFEEEFSKEKAIANRPWLLEKVKMLKNSGTAFITQTVPE